MRTITFIAAMTFFASLVHAGEALETVKEAEALMSEGKFLEASQKFDKAAEAFSRHMPLIVRESHLTTGEEDEFGNELPRKTDLFVKGEKIHTVVKMRGNGFKIVEDGYFLNVSIDVNIVDQDGQSILSKEDITAFKKIVSTFPSEFKLSFALDVEGLTSGNYVLHQRVKDLINGKFVENKFPFSYKE